MTLTQQTDHVQDGKDKLLTQFKDKPKIEGVLSAYMRQAQDLEDAYFEFLIDRFLADGEGVQLDNIGKIVDETREGKADNVYKIALAGKILGNFSEGTPEDIIAILKAMYPLVSLDVDETVQRNYTRIAITGSVGSLDEINAAWNTLLKAKNGAHALELIYGLTATLFTYDTVGLGYDGAAGYAGGFSS